MIGKWDTQVSFMDFWSDIDVILAIDTTAGDEALENVVIPEADEGGLPSGITPIRVIGMFKYSKRVDSSSAANYIESAQVISVDSSAGRDSVVTAINIPANSMHTASDATEGGDVLIGDNDVKSEVPGNGTYYMTWELADAHGDDLTLYDVQVGLRVYFR